MKEAGSGTITRLREEPSTLVVEADILSRMDVAADPETSDELLTMLSRDRSDFVRRAVAENPVTPPHVLDLLTTDEDENVRFAAAETLSAVYYCQAI